MKKLVSLLLCIIIVSILFGSVVVVNAAENDFGEVFATLTANSKEYNLMSHITGNNWHGFTVTAENEFNADTVFTFLVSDTNQRLRSVFVSDAIVMNSSYEPEFFEQSFPINTNLVYENGGFEIVFTIQGLADYWDMGIYLYDFPRLRFWFDIEFHSEILDTEVSYSEVGVLLRHRLRWNQMLGIAFFCSGNRFLGKSFEYYIWTPISGDFYSHHFYEFNLNIPHEIGTTVKAMIWDRVTLEPLADYFAIEWKGDYYGWVQIN